MLNLANALCFIRLVRRDTAALGARAVYRKSSAQIRLARDHVIVLTEDGDLELVKATPARHEELARFSAIEGKTWNHPVIAAGRLLVRNLQEMAAFDILPK